MKTKKWMLTAGVVLSTTALLVACGEVKSGGSNATGTKVADKTIKIGFNFEETGATAAYVTEDELAAGLLNGLFAAGKKVPEDFEIITSNDSTIALYTRPNMTSISQPIYDLGAVAMRMLTKIMNKEELEEKEIVLNHGIRERGTTK